ncbi:MAG: hypothetical protein FWC97_03225 [Treponema sp.]|nr:hypothetical protein [Treponema sp.]
MLDRIRIKGKVTVSVLDNDGKVKRKKSNWFQRLFGLQGSLMTQVFHNIVTRQGDALIADALLASPARTKVTSASGFIQVGTGWTGNSTKTNTRCNTPTGSMRALDSGFPALEASWGNLGDTTVTYRATFAAGTLNANGINEACLLNGNVAASNCLAYAQINPSVNVTSSDTLQILWEITILGQ